MSAGFTHRRMALAAPAIHHALVTGQKHGLDGVIRDHLERNRRRVGAARPAEVALAVELALFAVSIIDWVGGGPTPSPLSWTAPSAPRPALRLVGCDADAAPSGAQA